MENSVLTNVPKDKLPTIEQAVATIDSLIAQSKLTRIESDSLLISLHFLAELAKKSETADKPSIQNAEILP